MIRQIPRWLNDDEPDTHSGEHQYLVTCDAPGCLEQETYLGSADKLRLWGSKIRVVNINGRREKRWFDYCPECAANRGLKKGKA